MLQEKWYDGNGNVYKEKNYGHDQVTPPIRRITM